MAPEGDCLNCADTGYLFNSFMYRGKDEKRPPGMTATLYPVKRLTDLAVFQKKDHLMGLDNWYGQILAGLLLRSDPLDMHFTMTMRRKKQFIPADLYYSKTGNGLQRGAMRCFKASSEGVDFFFTARMDTKPVHLLSSFPPYKTTCMRNAKLADGSFGDKVSIIASIQRSK